jgi:CubicO group peptidase (beta-lactamase class C family)
MRTFAYRSNFDAARELGSGIALVTCLSVLACSSSDKAGGQTDGGPTTSGPTECLGMPLPPRALDKTPHASGLDAYFPTSEWRTATPAEAHIDGAKLDEALAFTTPQSTTQGLLVLRSGYIVAEQYAAGFDDTSRIESYSMAKSFSSALVGIAIDKGLLSGVDQKVCGYYSTADGSGPWDCDDASDLRTHITVEHTMNVETGLDWHEDWRSTATGVNDTLLGSANLLDYVLSKQGVDEPGTKKRYSTGDPSLLTGVLQGVTGKTALDFAREVLFRPIGIPDVQWTADSKQRTTTYAGVQATLREFGKFGFLYSKHGKWDGTQVVPGDWVDFTTRAKDPCVEQYRYLWHINLPLRLGKQDADCADFPSCVPTAFADFPGDAFFAEGIRGQFIFIVPSLDLVVVRGAADTFGSEYWDEYALKFLGMVLDAVE